MMTITTLDNEEIVRRTPVWEAMSELFVGKRLQNHDYQHIADVLNQSGYSVHELEVILGDEVAPVFHRNLGALALPEMEGWNVEFVKTAVLEHLSKPSCLMRRILPKRWIHHLYLAQVQNRWLTVRQLLTVSQGRNPRI